ncbi:MAG: ribonuclease HIII [Bacilli bacterium]
MTITLKISNNTKEKMIAYFQDKKRSKTPPYAVFQADEADTVITLYESGKAVFQGTSADIDATIWKQTEKKLNPLKEIEETNSQNKEKKDKQEIIVDQKIYNGNSIGSDEVGTGDYFGPIVVTAAYVNKKNIAFLEELGVKDSKKITDDKIIKMVPKIIKIISYKSIILTNQEYNDKYNKDTNMNKIKAIMHNKVLNEMVQQNFDVDYIIVDQFAPKYVYYNYLKETSNVVKNITFLTKGETRSMAVACAALISRYIFLEQFDKLGESVDMFLPKGASNLVDEAGVKIVHKYGFDKLSKLAKLNFKNTEKIKNYQK